MTLNLGDLLERCAHMNVTAKTHVECEMMVMMQDSDALVLLQ